MQAKTVMHKRVIFRRKVLKTLFFSGALSNTELSEKVQKSIPQTNVMLKNLMELGMVQKAHYAKSSGGRRPILYAVRKDALYIVSVVIGQFFTRIGIMDMHREYVRPVWRIKLLLSDNIGALVILTEEIRREIGEAGVPIEKIAGIGIVLPDLSDLRKGGNKTSFAADGQSITEFIAARTGCPVFMDNDSNGIALAEQRLGKIRDQGNMLVLNLGWGVGLGMILNSQLFREDSGLASGFRHIPLFVNDKLCECGKTGCLETETSLLVIVEKAIRGLKEGKSSLLTDLTPDDPESCMEKIIAAAGSGDTFSIALLSEVGYTIGRGIAVLIHLFNPGLIIISGKWSTAGKIWEASIQQAINVHCIPHLAGKVKLFISEMGTHAELLGAASLVMDNYDAFF